MRGGGGGGCSNRGTTMNLESLNHVRPPNSQSDIQYSMLKFSWPGWKHQFYTQITATRNGGQERISTFQYPTIPLIISLSPTYSVSTSRY